MSTDAKAITTPSEPHPELHSTLLWVVGSGLFVILGVVFTVWFRMELRGTGEIIKNSVKILGTLILVGCVFWFVERLWPEEEQTLQQKEIPLNGLFFFLGQGVMAKVAMTIVSAVVVVFTLIHIPRLPSNWITAQPWWLQAVEIAVFKDFFGYWNHRMFHMVPFLWRFHAVHHSSEQINWLSATREHPFEQIVSKCATVLPLYLLGYDKRVLGPFVGIWLIYLMFLHANTRLHYGRFKYFLVSPAYHRWHHTSEHSHIDRNFATLLPLWDYLFGTACDPGRRSSSYGLLGKRMDSGFFKMLAHPFKSRRVKSDR